MNHHPIIIDIDDNVKIQYNNNNEQNNNNDNKNNIRTITTATTATTMSSRSKIPIDDQQCPSPPPPPSCLMTSSSYTITLLLMTFLCMAIMIPLTSGFVINSKQRLIQQQRRQQCRSSSSSTSFLLHVTQSASPSETTTKTITTTAVADSSDDSKSVKNELEKKTVKELRLMVNDVKAQKGIKTSYLRLKKEMVSFLIKHDGQQQQPAAAADEKNDNKDEDQQPQPKETQTTTTKTTTQITPNSTKTPKNNQSPKQHRTPPLPPMPPLTTTADPPFKTKKDAIFDAILARYPGIDTLPHPITISSTTINDNDIRAQHHPFILDLSAAATDMDMTFIGTASCTPGTTRGTSCTALRLNWRRNLGMGRDETVNGKGGEGDRYNFGGGTWLFDCGECTQLQLQRSNSVKPGRITKIFLTHSHGDHTFGLPGLLCLMGQDRDRATSPPVDIYGPEGLRQYLRVAIRYSASRIVPNYRVHELMGVPMAPEWRGVMGSRDGRWRYFYDGRVRRLQGGVEDWTKGVAGEDPFSWTTYCCRSTDGKELLEADSYFGEVEGGRDIYPSVDHPLSSYDAPVWTVEDEGDVIVHAAPMSHGVPCVGYVIKEKDKPGRLRPELVMPVVKRNEEALREAGVKSPMKVLGVIKNMEEGEQFTFPDGTVVKQEDVVEERRMGRKVVICGDTADCRALEALAQNADILVHESTNAYLRGLDKETNINYVTKDAKIHGHSTPQMAGAFAKTINAKRLVMNHFSSRYKGDQSMESISIMTRIERQAVKASGLSEERVAAAWDFMNFHVPSN